MLRVLTLAAGLAGAGTFAQFPEFSQQYVQRLGGAVDALEQVVADFDASAAAEGLSRADALASMVGTGFVERRRTDMERTIDRFDHLSAQLGVVESAGPFMRAYHAADADTQIAKAAWQEFVPAMPLNFAGVVFAGLGFLLGTTAIGLLGGLLIAPFRARLAT
jgi:hypothetical protein